ncbi:hypothetical protein [Endozoicomonas sp. ISHI1]|nr:hypothetical protein [Endozoicomonas sp. ISHI1]
MKQISLDLIGVTGFSALMAGLYLQFGLSVALMSGGSLLLIFALAASRRS